MHKNVVIAGYVRSPFQAAHKGELTKVRPDEMAAQVVGYPGPIVLDAHGERQLDPAARARLGQTEALAVAGREHDLAVGLRHRFRSVLHQV